MSLKNIHRGTFTVAFLFNADITPVSEIKGMSVEELLEMTETGHAVGNLVGKLVIEPVAECRVEDELVALGNDGSFFDEDDD